MNKLIDFIASLLFCCGLIYLGKYVGKGELRDNIKDHKLIIIDKSTYRCEVVNTLEK